MFAIKKFTIYESDGHEYIMLEGLFQMYWTDPRLAGFPPDHEKKYEVSCNGLSMSRRDTTDRQLSICTGSMS